MTKMLWLGVTVAMVVLMASNADAQPSFSTFFTETMKCYHPLAQASIVGARVA